MKLSVDIKKNFPGFTLEAAFSTDGQTLGLLGGSGSGKSMTLKCIAGVVSPDEGHIELDGKIFFDSSAKVCIPPQQRHIGYLFQNYALFPHMTVAQNILCGMRRGTQKLDIGAVLDRFYLQGLENHYPSQLSGGQQQRVALARIVVSQPSVLMLDEPFSALDTYLRGEMELLIYELLQDFAGPVLIVSHNRDELYHLCSRIEVYNNGKIDVEGNMKDVFAYPVTHTAAILTGCRNVLPAAPTDRQTLWIEGWNTSLKTSHPLNEGICFVGIRAHHFVLVDDVQPNTVVCSIESVMESPFEMIVYLQPENGNHLLCWKTDKQIYKNLSVQNKIYLQIKPDAVLPLTSA